MSTKPCNLAQTTQIKLMNKSYERFMLSKCQEGASMDQKEPFKLYRDATLTKINEWLMYQFWGLTFKKSYSLSGAQRTSFLEHTLN